MSWFGQRIMDLGWKGVDTVNQFTPHFPGAVDIIVVEQPDGTIKSSNFFVRFGKYTTKWAKDKNVRIFINGQELPFCMAVNIYGEAFFVVKQDQQNDKKNKEASMNRSESTDSETSFKSANSSLDEISDIYNKGIPLKAQFKKAARTGGQSTAQKVRSRLHNSNAEIQEEFVYQLIERQKSDGDLIGFLSSGQFATQHYNIKKQNSMPAINTQSNYSHFQSWDNQRSPKSKSSGELIEDDLPFSLKSSRKPHRLPPSANHSMKVSGSLANLDSYSGNLSDDKYSLRPLESQLLISHDLNLQHQQKHIKSPNTSKQVRMQFNSGGAAAWDDQLQPQKIMEQYQNTPPQVLFQNQVNFAKSKQARSATSLQNLEDQEMNQMHKSDSGVQEATRNTQQSQHAQSEIKNKKNSINRYNQRQQENLYMYMQEQRNQQEQQEQFDMDKQVPSKNNKNNQVSFEDNLQNLNSQDKQDTVNLKDIAVGNQTDDLDQEKSQDYSSYIPQSSPFQQSASRQLGSSSMPPQPIANKNKSSEYDKDEGLSKSAEFTQVVHPVDGDVQSHSFNENNGFLRSNRLSLKKQKKAPRVEILSKVNLLNGLQMSLCGVESLKLPKNRLQDKFKEYMVDERLFAEYFNEVIQDPNLILKVDQQYLNFKDAQTRVLSLLAFGKDLSVVQNDLEYEQVQIQKKQLTNDMILYNGEVPVQEKTVQKPGRQKERSTFNYRKVKFTTQLSQDQLQYVKGLINKGPNSVVFNLNGYKVSSYLYYYKHDVKIVVSDVDGTITKSDVLGHIIPRLGYDYAHSGIAPLFTDIERQGYEVMYLSSRAIAQSTNTHMYIRKIQQRIDNKTYTMPDGPVILSSEGILPSLYREVIRRKPDEFKIPALQTIRSLFPVDFNPFFSGFGNRDTDRRSYLKVTIPEWRIFIIDPYSRIRCLDELDDSEKKQQGVSVGTGAQNGNSQMPHKRESGINILQLASEEEVKQREKEQKNENKKQQEQDQVQSQQQNQGTEKQKQGAEIQKQGTEKSLKNPSLNDQQPKESLIRKFSNSSQKKQQQQQQQQQSQNAKSNKDDESLRVFNVEQQHKGDELKSKNNLLDPSKYQKIVSLPKNDEKVEQEQTVEDVKDLQQTTLLKLQAKIEQLFPRTKYYQSSYVTQLSDLQRRLSTRAHMSSQEQIATIPEALSQENDMIDQSNHTLKVNMSVSDDINVDLELKNGQDNLKSRNTDTAQEADKEAEGMGLVMDQVAPEKLNSEKIEQMVVAKSGSIHS